MRCDALRAEDHYWSLLISEVQIFINKLKYRKAFVQSRILTEYHQSQRVKSSCFFFRAFLTERTWLLWVAKLGRSISQLWPNSVNVGCDISQPSFFIFIRNHCRVDQPWFEDDLRIPTYSIDGLSAQSRPMACHSYQMRTVVTAT